MWDVSSGYLRFFYFAAKRKKKKLDEEEEEEIEAMDDADQELNFVVRVT